MHGRVEPRIFYALLLTALSANSPADAVRRATRPTAMVGFAGAIYQNPASICPQHQMMLPRLIRSQIVKGQERPKKAR